MKLKLIQMPFVTDLNNSYDFNASSLLPLSIATLAASLRNNGFNVDVDDLNIKAHRDKRIDLKIFFDLNRCINHISNGNDIEIGKVIEQMLHKTDMNGYDVFLLSYSRSWNLGTKGMFLAFNHYIKKNFGGIIIAGGMTNTNKDFQLLNLLMKDKSILDYLITGYGEDSIIKLLKALMCGKPEENIEGLVYSRGKIIRQEINKPYKMAVPYNLKIRPDFDGLPLDLYKRRINGDDVFIIPLKLNEGCPYSCAFCYESVRIKNIKTINLKEFIDFIKNLKEKYNTPFFSFLDSTFNTSKKFVEDFCHEIINSGLKIYWNDSARLDRHIFTDEVIELMRKAGCIHLVFGLESASQRMLNFIKKGVTLENASAILKKTSEVGIWNGINLIAGLPFEKEEDIDNTVEFINSHRDFIDECWYYAFYLEKESDFYKNPGKYGLENIQRLYKKNFKDRELYNSIYFAKYFRYSFDEAYGLKWPEKLKQINCSYLKLRSNIKINHILPSYNHFPVLFYLYNQYDIKNKIKSEYFKIKKRMLFKFMLKPRSVYRHIYNHPTMHNPIQNLNFKLKALLS